MRPLKLNSVQVLTYGLPLLVILFSVCLAASPLLKQYPQLATAITYDLTVTTPLLFLLLSRKSTVSKLKVVPFFVLGIVVASYVLPENGRTHLGFIKTYALPVVELIVFTLLIHKISLGIKTFKSNSGQTSDFSMIAKKSAAEIFGQTKLATFFSSEITMFYYAFFDWKKRKLKSNEFTNYKENGSLALAGAVLMVVFIETYAFHVLLMKWSSIAAWILTATSIYTAFAIFGHIKALVKRPSLLTEKQLIMKNGLLADITIPLNEIDTITVFTKEMQSENLKIGNLGLSKESTDHNIAIHFKTRQTIEKIYGFTEECDVLLVHIDNKNVFIEQVNKRIQ